MTAKTLPDPFLWLTSDEAAPILALAAHELMADATSLVRLTAKLRKTLSSDQVHLLLEQIDLRRRAKDKFSAAERMFFAPQALMQASDEVIAAYKAVRFPAGERFADLCCGIGGDLLVLAAQGICVGVDRDRTLAHLAQRNCEVTGRGGGSAVVADAATFPVQEFAAWHIDPDRRPGGKRTTRVEHYDPPLDVLEILLTNNPHAAIKLAPAAEVSLQWEQVAEREWLESRGECRQQVAWFGSLARRPGEKSATIVDALGGPRTVQGRGEGPVPIANGVSRYVYEPAAAVLAAKLTHVLCEEHRLQAVSNQAMYLTGDALAEDPTLAGFEVLEVLPLDERQLKAWLRQRGMGQLEVKKRGCDVEPEKLRKRLGGEGHDAGTLLVCPLRGRVQAIVARRV
ncbi:MAG: class I SAM-dependent methyltransferase [Pirellulaceae bacterium]|nr:class I SAM-dependent methyltransferase [Pirellulaceae bacterium]